jgi:RimJ/RimL family protein N-acetyltransferase
MIELLHDTLVRNQGAILTPELIHGVLRTVDTGMSETLWSSVPTKEPEPPRALDPRILVTEKERVGNWVAERVGQHASWGGYVALGMRNTEGELIAGVVINDLTGTNGSIHVAFANKYALRRVFIYAVFDYAFNQLGLTRLTGYVEADNYDALTFDHHLGFELEHTIRDGSENGDVHMLVLWKDKCRWLKRGDN